jgi:cardiolipin synthase
MRSYAVPNALTIFRLAVTPLAVYLLARSPEQPPYRTYAFLILVAQQASDILDGFLARRIRRRTGAVNRLGEVLDPVTLSLVFGFPLWVTLTIIVKELLLLTGWLLRSAVFKVRVVRPNFFGKAAECCQAGLIFAFLLNVAPKAMTVGIAVTVSFTLTAGVIYGITGVADIRRAQTARP